MYSKINKKNKAKQKKKKLNKDKYYNIMKIYLYYLNEIVNNNKKK